MQKIIEDTLLKGQHLIQSLKQPDLSVITLSIYHSTQILLQLNDRVSGKVYQVTCDQCKYFKGDVGVWSEVNLSLSYIMESVKSGERTRENYLFELRDLKHDYFVRCKHLLFDEASDDTGTAPETNAEAFDKTKIVPEDNSIEKLHAILREHDKSRVRIFNSDKNLLTIRLDGNTEQRFLDFSRQTDQWYKLDTAHYFDILCYNPVFMNVNFESWETKEALKIYKDQDVFVLSDVDSGFSIKCPLITINK